MSCSRELTNWRVVKLFKKKNEVVKPLRFPAGFIVHTEQGYYYVQGNKRLKFISARAADSWHLHVIYCKESDVDVPVKGTLGFRPASVLKDYASHKVYLLEQGKLKQIVEPDFLESIGNPPVIEVNPSEIKYHIERSKNG